MSAESENTAWQSQKKLSIAVVCLIAVNIVLSFMRIATSAHVGALLLDVVAGHPYPTEYDKGYASSVDAPIALIGVISLVIAGVCVILWLKRSRENLPALNAEGARQKPYWAFWGFIIPILNLWKPLLMAQEIFKASDPDNLSATGWSSGKASWLVGFWWFTWILSQAIIFFSNFLAGMAGQEADLLFSYYALTVVGKFVQVISGCLLIAVVLKLTGRQEAKHLKLAAAGVGAAGLVEPDGIAPVVTPPVALSDVSAAADTADNTAPANDSAATAGN